MRLRSSRQDTETSVWHRTDRANSASAPPVYRPIKVVNQRPRDTGQQIAYTLEVRHKNVVEAVCLSDS